MHRTTILLLLVIGIAWGSPLCVGAAAADSPRNAMSATGQTKCYDGDGVRIPCAGTGQDGEIQFGARLRFRDNGDGTVTDLNTGLMWEKKSRSGRPTRRETAMRWRPQKRGLVRRPARDRTLRT